MNCHGKAASASQLKYGWNQDTRDVAREDVFNVVAKFQNPKTNLTTLSDAKTEYPKLAKKFAPDAEFVQLSSRIAKEGGPDAIFSLNYTAAQL
jgi:hypothetical protein